MLLDRVQQGDDEARDMLFRRYCPALRRWASGRLPSMGRDLSDTDDLVQVTLIRALGSLASFQANHQGSFLAYLRTILYNAVREELRRAGRYENRKEQWEMPAGADRSALDEAITSETLSQYEAALEELGEQQRDAVVLRLEFGLSYPEIADELGGRSTSNSVRMLVARGLVRLAEAMP